MDPTIVAAAAITAAVAGVLAAAWCYRRARVAEAQAAQLRRDLLAERIAARRDVVTGLLNRRGFFEFGTALLTDPSRRPSVVVLVEADLEAFRSADNTDDQVAGDQILAALSRRFADYSRGHVVARLGDNRLGALLRASTTTDGTQYPHMDDLSAILAEPIWFGGYQVRVATCVAQAKVEEAMDLGTALRRAEAKIRRAKRSETVLMLSSAGPHPVDMLDQRRPGQHRAKGPVYYRSRVIARHYRRP